MKVKEKYYARGDFHLTTTQLIERGVSSRDGQIENIEAQLSHLMDVVAALVDHSGLSDAVILKITGCEGQYDVSDEPDA